MSKNPYEEMIWRLPPTPNINGQTWRDAYFDAAQERDRYRAAIIAHLDKSHCLESEELINALGSGRLPTTGE